MGKGTAFERDLSKMLSLWWTRGQRDDVFWHTQGSGGRATNRRKRGKKTFGQEGDIQAIDPIGQPLLDVFTIEAKKGYNRVTSTVADSLDNRPRHSVKTKRLELFPQVWDTFIAQARKESKAAGTRYWLMIHRRDHHEMVVFMPWRLIGKLHRLKTARPRMTFVTRKGLRVFGTTLPEFLRLIKPGHIKRLPKSGTLKLRRKK